MFSHLLYFFTNLFVNQRTSLFCFWCSYFSSRLELIGRLKCDKTKYTFFLFLSCDWIFSSGTLITEDNKPFFKNAKIVIGKAELELWRSEHVNLCCFGYGTEASSEEKHNAVIAGAKRVFGAFDDAAFLTVEEETEVCLSFSPMCVCGFFWAPISFWDRLFQV